MTTLNTIWEEIQHVPISRLDEVYHFVHTLNLKKGDKEARTKKMLSLAGSFGDMSEKEYKAFVKETKTTRKRLFKRKVKL